MSAALATPASPALRSFEAQWQARAADALAPLRERAMQRFLTLGLPSTRDEGWRYTNLRALAARQFVDAPALGVAAAPAADSLLTQPKQALTLMMVDGVLQLPADFEPINGIEINSLKNLSQVDFKRLSALSEPLSDEGDRRFELLNTALFRDALHVKITSEVALPLQILHISSAVSADSASYPRVIIETVPNAGATVIEHYLSGGSAPALVNSLSHANLAANSRLEHYRVFAGGAGSTHLDSLTIRQAEDSQCRQFTMAVGGALVKTSLRADLNGRGAELHSQALLVGHGSRHVDCLNVVTHASPHTTSRQTARAIASDVSRVVFNSKVVVNKGADHSNSQQSCRGLILSPTAEIDSRPQLEIHADEVKCAHGATTGRLDPDMLFYMLSRGLDRNTAQSVLVFAFLADVLTGMSVTSARTAIENSLINQLPDSQLLRNLR
jgi:Fe-S cluster assembly protein SufD